MSDVKEKSDLTSAMFGSSVLVACVRCCSKATYRGSPEKVNAAAKEFYELHEQCWKRYAEKKESR